MRYLMFDEFTSRMEEMPAERLITATTADKSNLSARIGRLERITSILMARVSPELDGIPGMDAVTRETEGEAS